MVEFPGRFAAAALLPGTGATGFDPCLVGRSALWAFHGENDNAGGGVFDASQLTAWVDGVASCPEPHPVAQLTMYVGQGHNVWARTLSLQAMSDPAFDTFAYGGGMVVDTVPYAPDLYTWLLQHDLPEVYAGPDITVSEDDVTFDLHAQVEDFDPVAFTWTQTSGPAMTLTNADSATVTVSALAVGTHTFRVFALDADDQYDEDVLTVEVVEGTPPDESESASDSDSESASASDSESASDSDSDSGTGSSSSSTSGDETSGDTSTGGEGSSGGSSSGTSGDSDATSSGGDPASTSGADPSSTSDSASGSGSEGGQSTASSASDTTTPGGSEGTGEDTGEGGGADDGGGCSTGGRDYGPAHWMLGLLGLGLRRRRCQA